MLIPYTYLLGALTVFATTSAPCNHTQIMTLQAGSPVGGGSPYWPANHDEHSYIIYKDNIPMGRHQLLNILAGKKNLQWQTPPW